MTDAWYEAYVSGDDRREGEGDEYAEEEVEDVADDEPMRVAGRIFIGSIDAARNVDAMKRLRIGAALALLGRGEERAAVSSRSSCVEEQYAELGITRTTVQIEDSKEGDLLRRLPGILAALEKLVEKAEQENSNVLVHCIAGRSRSASVVAAWMLVNEPKQQDVQDIIDRIRIVRPWIEINAYFMQDLHLFHDVLASSVSMSLSAENVALLHDRVFPRLDFGANLVDGILRGTKTITMRLLSDIEGDRNSDLGSISSFSIVSATTSRNDGSPTRAQFGYLRIDQIEIKELSVIDQATLRKSGFDSTDEVLGVLKQFYPTVTSSTPFLMLHFHCLAPV